MIAAQLPGRGNVPRFLSATSNSITLGFNVTVNTGGSPVFLYKLYATLATDDG